MDSKPFPPELQPLANLLDKPNPQLVIVVGAGVTIGATNQPHTSWLGLLEHGIEHIVTEQQLPEKWRRDRLEKLRLAFTPFDLDAALDAAQDIEHNLTYPDEDALEEWLKSVFKDFKARDDKKATIEALRDLEQAGALILTTNYDNLLEDITGLPAVTWEEHDDFRRVTTRNKRGILHLHGHWQRPSSIVLGRNSYNRIKADSDIQDLLKGLWLDKNWLYVGCGKGLNDPNLGCLLAWSKHWGVVQDDYFLAQEVTAADIASRPYKPQNLKSIGYPSHDDLPEWLRFITPTARCWPFVRIDDEFPLFRTPGSDIPFPTRQEYLNGEVPTLAADAEVEKRIQTLGWACVMDVASVGKTTLALRLAISHQQRQHLVFYLDLKSEILDEESASPIEALSRLTRSGVLFILDNVHHQPEIARHIWQQWKYNHADSRMLLVATRVQQLLVTAPEQDLMFFEKHPVNPAILLQLTPEDLGGIAKYIYRRVSGSPMPEPHPTVLAEWHRKYRAALNAFCFSVMERCANFQKGKWDIPDFAAAAWVHERWLKKLNEEERENVICLSAFGAQELEIQILNEALPFPDKIEKLFKLGLVAQTKSGKLGQYRQISLLEPGWGHLILAAVNANIKEVRFNAAIRHPILAVALVARLKSAGLHDELAQFLDLLDKEKIGFSEKLPDIPLQITESLLNLSKAANRENLSFFFWETIEARPEKFADRIWETSPQSAATFLNNMACKYGRDPKPLWHELIGEIGQPDQQAKLDRLAEYVWKYSLTEVDFFIFMVNKYGHDTEPIWNALIGEDGELDRETKIEKFTLSAWKTKLDYIGAFLNTAQKHGRNTQPLWDALIGKDAELNRQAKLDRFVECAWEAKPDGVGSFLNVAWKHGRNTEPLWDALIGKDGELNRQAKLAKFAACAWKSRLHSIGSFLNTAQKHGRNTESLWDALIGKDGDLDRQTKLEKFVALAWEESSLTDVGSFLNAAQKHGHNTESLWDAFIGKDGDLDRQNKLEKFVALAWEETSLTNVGSFLDVSWESGINTELLWDALIGKDGELDRQSKLDKFASRAWETPLTNVSSFLSLALKHGRNTGPLWEAMDSQPSKLAKCVWEASLEHIGLFLGVTESQGRDTAWLWETMESAPDRLSRKTKNAKLNELVSFMHHAPTPIIEIILQNIEAQQLNSISPSNATNWGAWLYWHFINANRNDLARYLIYLLLPESSDFANACWSLVNAPPFATELVESFLKTVCTEDWLSYSYKHTPCGQLANGLKQLALHQSKEFLRCFNHQELDQRLNKEMEQFKVAGKRYYWPGIIQFLGSAYLCGKMPSPQYLVNIDSLIRPQLLPHRPEAKKVGNHQWQFWLGLRAFVSTTCKPLPVAKGLIEETLRLWHINLAETSTDPSSTEHLINQNMVEWLENCLRANPVELLP